jgi:S-formylglutathione hydrolase FrmB
MRRSPFGWSGRLGHRRELPAGFHEVHWHSRALHKRMAFVVSLPATYSEQPARRWPVLFLLHGSGHDRHSVLREVAPQDHAQWLDDTLLVIPDGDQGWWLDSPLLPHSYYGQYVLELLEFVDHRYRTILNRAARGICGFSMGGYGAMLLAAQHPVLFGAASSLLGPLDIVQMHPQYHRLALLLGPELMAWQHHNPTCLASSLTDTALLFCTAEEAFDRSQSEAFAAALTALHIPFEHTIYPGEHDTAFVRQHIGEHLSFHCRAFDQAR